MKATIGTLQSMGMRYQPILCPLQLEAWSEINKMGFADCSDINSGSKAG